ncbi:hypothetical protein [Bdellovibrio sp. HCB337]|uniref:hypothetical protein n=1 Tax=Bdellovibrio sp. HCB337 TaxID=3394358 RepID=UPI0039A6CD67
MGKVLFVVFSLAAQTVFAASANFAEQMQTTPCKSNLSAELSAHLPKQTWTPKPVSIPGKHLMTGIAFRDTRKHKAYQIWAEKGKSYLQVTDLKTKKETVQSWSLAQDCKMETVNRSAQEVPLATTKGFTDADLAKTMKAHKWGIIYVWTPYMPLSVKGLAEIKAAVKAEGGHLTVLMDPKAHINEAKKWAEKGMVQKSEMTPVASTELVSREMGLHYPVTYIYKDQFVSNRDYVGHKSAKVFKRWIASEMAELNKDLK